MKNIKAARRLIADIYEDLMNDIPMAKDDETLDEEVDRDMEMESELEGDSLDMVMKALKKKYNIQSDNLTDVLDEASEKAKREEIAEDDFEGSLN